MLACSIEFSGVFAVVPDRPLFYRAADSDEWVRNKEEIGRLAILLPDMREPASPSWSPPESREMRQSHFPLLVFPRRNLVEEAGSPTVAFWFRLVDSDEEYGAIFLHRTRLSVVGDVFPEALIVERGLDGSNADRPVDRTPGILPQDRQSEASLEWIPWIEELSDGQGLAKTELDPSQDGFLFSCDSEIVAAATFHSGTVTAGSIDETGRTFYRAWGFGRPGDSPELYRWGRGVASSLRVDYQIQSGLLELKLEELDRAYRSTSILRLRGRSGAHRDELTVGIMNVEISKLDRARGQQWLESYLPDADFEDLYNLCAESIDDDLRRVPVVAGRSSAPNKPCSPTLFQGFEREVGDHVK